MVGKVDGKIIPPILSKLPKTTKTNSKKNCVDTIAQGDTEESGVIYADRKKPEGWYVSVSDIPIDDVQAWEDGGVEYHEAGAVYIGELTHMQYTVFQKEFSKAYKGQYVVSYRCKMQLSKEDELALQVWLGNYDYLSDEQREVLNIAVRVTNQVRTADGCGDRNIAEPVRKKTKKTGSNAKQSSTKPCSVNARLTDFLYKNPNLQDKAAQFYATELGCSKPAIIATGTWKMLMSKREKKPKTGNWKDPGKIPDRSENNPN